MNQFIGVLISPFIGLLLWGFAALLAVAIMRMIPDGRIKRLLHTRLHPITVYAGPWVKRLRQWVIKQSRKHLVR